MLSRKKNWRRAQAKTSTKKPSRQIRWKMPVTCGEGSWGEFKVLVCWQIHWQVWEKHIRQQGSRVFSWRHFPGKAFIIWWASVDLDCWQSRRHPWEAGAGPGCSHLFHGTNLWSQMSWGSLNLGSSLWSTNLSFPDGPGHPRYELVVGNDLGGRCAIHTADVLEPSQFPEPLMSWWLLNGISGAN